MSLRHALLGYLAEEPGTGYSLLKHFDGSVGYAWPARQGQIYPELNRLREEGLIRQRESGARNSKTYEVTEAGIAELRRWLRETEPSRAVRNEPLLRVFFLWLLEPAEREAYLRKEAEYQRALLGELERIEREEQPPRGPKGRSYRLALERGIATTRAVLEWAERAAGAR
ncbi:MAG TPA: PadR family transcriptional regulator [Gaiellaceae bacterium]|nr:PadR family transcriptional regulator [Gaiellaceae bacterium]